MTGNWLDRTEYPFKSKFFNLDRQKLHYIEEGEGETLLFLHGTPSWSFDFRNVVKKLKENFRCVAIDHIGFGLSDKPKHYDYSVINHSRTLEKFVLTNHLDNLTIVAHDFGGPIGLSFAMRHPDRVKQFIILNSWMWNTQSEPEFIKMNKFLNSPLLPFLYRYLNFSPRYLLPKSFGEKKISKVLLKQYTKPFAIRDQRNGTLAFARAFLTDQEWFEELWNQRDKLSKKPILFIWGMKDPLIKPRCLNKFISGFPNSSVLKLDTCGHFPQEEDPEKVADAMKIFLNEHK